MKLLLISITTVVILLGLFLSLLIILSIPTIPIKYVSTISFYDGQINQIIPNQKFYLNYGDVVGTIETESLRTNPNGYIDIDLKKRNKSQILVGMYDKIHLDAIFLFRIKSQQIEEGATICPESDKRPDHEQREHPLPQPRLEIKVGKRKLL